MQSISIYIHIPFCTRRCGYCDFNTYAGLEGLISSYCQAICREISILSSSVKERLPISTIYFGGGTPSLLPINEIQKILLILNKDFNVEGSVEISFEANPGTVTKEYLVQLRLLGVNRLSFGMQSANPSELVLLERQHLVIDIKNSVEWARIAGFNNLNLDLIFGLPNQEINAWVTSIQAALSLHPEHLSLYALTIEKGTPLYHKVIEGFLPEPDQDLAADMYDYACIKLSEAGYSQYEISNWALFNQNGNLFSCHHNLQYWRNLPYIGIGAGAHGYINHIRTENVLKPGEYINRLNFTKLLNDENLSFPRTPATKQITIIDNETEIGETMMMGLRLVREGVPNKKFKKKFGVSLQQRFGPQINRLIEIGLLEWAGDEMDALRLTNNGRLLGNQVFKEFI
jgi:oxygen-independent coproporphyrinogen III oxidase